MLRGLTTVNLFADDVQAAVDWYADVLDAQPYFQRDIDGRPAYVEFRIGDYLHEVGILDSRFAPHPVGEPAGAMTYWAVDDVHAAHQRLLSLGARPHAEPAEHGPGFVTASVFDPFGNVVGVMFNEHYLSVLDDRADRGAPAAR